MANFLLKSNPVANTAPSLNLSFHTFPPAAITPFEIPPSANTVMVPNIVFTKVYNAYSFMGNNRIIKMPQANPTT